MLDNLSVYASRDRVFINELFPSAIRKAYRYYYYFFLAARKILLTLIIIGSRTSRVHALNPALAEVREPSLAIIRRR